MNADLLISVAGTLFVALVGIAIAFGIVRSNRGPSKLHDLAARLAAKHGGRVVPGRWARPIVHIPRGTLRYRIEWWRGPLGPHRRGPATWVDVGPVDERAAALQGLRALPPGWLLDAYQDGMEADDEAPAAWLLRVTIPGHAEDDAQLELALALLDGAASAPQHRPG